MGRIIWRIIVILSISLNLAFVGSLVFSPATAGDHDSALELSETQKHQVQKIQQAVHQKNDIIKQKIARCQKDLLAALNQEKIDKNKINQCIADISAMQKEIQMNTVDQLLQIREHLDENQCNCLMNELEAGMTQKNQPCTKGCCKSK